MPYLHSYLFPDPLLSDKFFYFEDYPKLSEEGKIPGKYFLDFLKHTAQSYITKQFGQERRDEKTKQNAIYFLMDRFFSELGIPIEVDLSTNDLAKAYYRNLLPAAQKEYIDNKYNRYKTNIINEITTTRLVHWINRQLTEKSPISITDRLIKEAWIDLNLNKERLKNPESYFYKRNNVERASPALSLVNDNYAIFPGNILLSWVKIENKKHNIVDLIYQNEGLAQLQEILPADQKSALVNYLIQTANELNLFFKALNPSKKRQGFNWLQETQLDLNLRGSEASEVLLDFLIDENRSLLQKVESFSALATYVDPYFTDDSLTFINYQALTDEDIESKINEKIKIMYGYAKDRSPIYPDRMGMDDKTLTAYLKAQLEGGKLENYKKEYSKTLDKIGHWLDQNDIESSQNILGSIILKRFNHRLFDEGYELYFLNHHENTPYIYIVAKKALEDIAVLLEDESINIEQRKHQMQTMLADDTFEVCTAGCVSKISATSEALRIQFYKPNTETQVKRFINSQIQEIIRQSFSNNDPTPLKAFVSLLWNQDAAAGGMDVHAENYIRKQLATYLEMGFIISTEKDTWVENAEANLANKPEAIQVEIQLLTHYVIKELKTKLTLGNLIEFIWNSKTDLEYDELYNDLELLADVINPDKKKYQLSENYLRHYLNNLDLDGLKKQYLASLGDEHVILGQYFPQENIDAIRAKYPAGCHSLIDYIVDYYAGSQEVYDKMEDGAKSFYQKHLVNTARLLFVRAYLQKLDQEAWINFDLDKPRLQDPVSYFKQRNPDLKQISAFNAQSDQYRIFYANLGISWARIQDKDQFILDIFADEKGLNTLSDLFPKGQMKEAVNVLFQTSDDLNRLFDKLTKSQYLQASSWLSDSGLDLSAKSVYEHFLLLKVLYEVEALKKSQKITPYLSVKNQIALMKHVLSKYPDPNKKLKLYVQAEIDKLAVISFDDTDPIFDDNLKVWVKSISALVDQLSEKNKKDGKIKIEDQFKEIYRLLDQFSKDYETYRQALQEKLWNNSDKKGLEEKIQDLAKFIEDSRKKLKLEITRFDEIATQLVYTDGYSVDNRILVQSVVEQGLNVLNIPNRYTPLIDEINFLVKEKLLTDFSNMMFIPPFTDLSPSKEIDSPLFYEKIDFSSCDLGNAFFMADIFKTNFNYANLKKVIFTQFSDRRIARWTGKFEDASFSTDSFLKLLKTLKRSKYYDLTAIDLQEVDFQDESLLNFFRNFPFKYLNLDYANLQGADFSSYDLTNIVLSSANLKQAKFKDVFFDEDHDLSSFQLEDAVFENVKLANLKQFFALYSHGIRDFTSIEVSDGNKEEGVPPDSQILTLVDAVLSNNIFSNLVSIERKDFKGVNLKAINPDNFKQVKDQLEYDLDTKFPKGCEPILTSYQKLFDLYDGGIRNFSTYSFSIEVKMRILMHPLPAHLLNKSLSDMVFSNQLFLDLYAAGRRDFRGVDLRNVFLSLINQFIDESMNTPSKLLFDRSTQLPQPALESKISRQKAYLALNKKLQKNNKNKLAFKLKAVNQGLYFPSYDKAKLASPPGECIAITRGFLQSLFLGQEKVFLDNLRMMTEFSERVRLGQGLSEKEMLSYKALSRLLGYFKQGVENQSSLPSAFIQYSGIRSLKNVASYLNQVVPSGNFAANIIMGNHVVSLYWQDGICGYFDSNVGWVSGPGNTKRLGEVLEAAVHSAAYEVRPEGVRIEVWDVAAANQELPTEHQNTLITEIETERGLLLNQDRNLGHIEIEGHPISRVALYDMGAKLQRADGSTLLINSEMSGEAIKRDLQAGKMKVSALNYLQVLQENFNTDSNLAIFDATAKFNFLGTAKEIERTKKVRAFIASEKWKMLNHYEVNQVLKAPKTFPFYSAIAKQRRQPNGGRLQNAAGQISFLRGLHSTANALINDDIEGFFLGGGEIGFSFLSGAIEKKIVKITPKFIKQLKSGIFISRGAAGLLGSTFDIVDLVQSSIALSKAEKNSKEYRDAIAGVVFSSASVTSEVVLTALGKAGGVVGFVIVIGQMIYMAASTVHEFKMKYGISDEQSARLFFHTLVFMSPPEDVQTRAARKNQIKLIIEKSAEYLEFLGEDVGIYGVGLGETIRTPSGGYTSEPSYGYIHLSDVDVTRVNRNSLCDTFCSSIESYSLEESLKNAIYRQQCQLPIITFQPPYQKPIIKEYGLAFDVCGENIYITHNKTRLLSLKDTRGIYDLSMINKGHIEVRLPIPSLKDTEFLIHAGNMTIEGIDGEDKTNWFRIQNSSLPFIGSIIGGAGAKNILDLSKIGADIVVYDQNFDRLFSRVGSQIRHFTYFLPKPKEILEDFTKKNYALKDGKSWAGGGAYKIDPFLKNFNITYNKLLNNTVNYFIGSDQTRESVTCAENKPLLIVNTRGNSKVDDYDVVKNCKIVYVSGQTKVFNKKEPVLLYVKPSFGQTEINVEGGTLIFEDHDLLTSFSISYSTKKNELTFSMPEQSFKLIVHNYWNLTTNEPHFKLIDHYPSEIRFMINLDQMREGSQAIDRFTRIASMSPEDPTHMQWKNKQHELTQVKLEVEQKKMNLFLERENGRNILYLIGSKKAELKHQYARLIQLSIGNNPDSRTPGEIEKNGAEKKALVNANIEKLETEIRMHYDQFQSCQDLIKNSLYKELDTTQASLEKIQQAEKRAQERYELMQELTENKKKIEPILVEAMQKQKDKQTRWFRSQKDSLLELISSTINLTLQLTAPYYSDQGLETLYKFINDDQIKEAYRFYFSNMSNTLSLVNQYTERMSNSTNAYGMVSTDIEKNKLNVLLGSSMSDSFPITSETAYVQGGNGSDIYHFVNGTGYNFITINNNAADNELDILDLSAAPNGINSTHHYQCGLLVSLTSGDSIYIKDYFLSTANKHLAFIDEQKKMWVADPSVSDCHSQHLIFANLSMIPFYAATTGSPLYSISKKNWSGMSSLVVHTEFDQLIALYEKNNLILKGENAKNQSLIIRLHDFYPISTDKNRILYTYPDFSLIDLNELAQLALPAKEIEETLVQESIQIHTVPDKQSVVIPSTLNASKTQLLALEEMRPNDIVVSRTNTDLVLRRANQSITLKDWDAKNATRIDYLWFAQLDRGLNMDNYYLNQTVKLQTALKQLDLVGAIDDKIKGFDRSVSDALIYFLALNSKVNDLPSEAALGFESSDEMIDFILAYGASLTEQSFKQQVCTDSFLEKAIQVLPWILIRGFIKEPNESIQKNVFAYLIDTNNEKKETYFVEERNGITAHATATTKTFFAQFKNDFGDLLKGNNLLNLEKLVKNFRLEISKKELSKSLACQHLFKSLSLKMHNSELHESVQAETKKETSSSATSWTMPVVWGAITAVSSFAVSLSYSMLGYLRRERQQPTGVAAAAAVMIPLMQLQSQQVEAVVTETKGFSAQIKQAIPIIPCSRESFFKPITADKQVPKLEESAANHSQVIPFQYEADHYGNASLIKLGVYFFGKRSVVKRMSEVERMSTYCERDDRKSLPEDLYRAIGYLEGGIALFGEDKIKTCVNSCC